MARTNSSPTMRPATIRRQAGAGRRGCGPSLDARRPDASGDTGQANPDIHDDGPRYPGTFLFDTLSDQICGHCCRALGQEGYHEGWELADGLVLGQTVCSLRDVLGHPLREALFTDSMGTRTRVLLMDRRQPFARKSIGDADQGRPQAAVDEGHLPVDEPRADDVRRVGEDIERLEDRVAARGGPTSFLGLVHRRPVRRRWEAVRERTLEAFRAPSTAIGSIAAILPRSIDGRRPGVIGSGADSVVHHPPVFETGFSPAGRR